MKKSGIFILAVLGVVVAFCQSNVNQAVNGQNQQMQVHKPSLQVGAKLSNSSVNQPTKAIVSAPTKPGLATNTGKSAKLPVGKPISSPTQPVSGKLATNKSQSMPVQSVPGGHVKYGKRIPAATLPANRTPLPVGAKISTSSSINATNTTK